MEFREFRQQLSHTLWDRVVLSQALLFGSWWRKILEAVILEAVSWRQAEHALLIPPSDNWTGLGSAGHY